MNNANFPFPKFPWTRSFVTRVSCISFHPTRNFPDPQKRYQVFVGRSFWRLVTFVYSASVSSNLNKDSPKQRNESSPKPQSNSTELTSGETAFDKILPNSPLPALKSPDHPPTGPSNAIIVGVRGCGKSHVLMTAAAFLTARNMSDLYRIVCIGDCKNWMSSDNPVAYFSLELMMAFRPHESSKDSKGSCSNPPNDLIASYSPPGVFTNFDDLKNWFHAVSKRVYALDDMRLVIFIDQIEEIYSSPQSPIKENLPSRIIDLLVSLKFPVLITSLTPTQNLPAKLPDFFKNPSIFSEMKMTSRLTFSEFDLFLDVFDGSKKFTPSDNSLIHDIRMWTGSNPGQTESFFRCYSSIPSGSVAEALGRWRRDHLKSVKLAIERQLPRIDKLSKIYTVLFIFRMLIHAPSDDPIPPHLSQFFLQSTLHKFYHPSDGIVAYRHIPTANSLATHWSLLHPSVLASILGPWNNVLETVLASILDAKTVCWESKRRIIRFYAHFKLFLLSSDPFEEASPPPQPPFKTLELSGFNQFNDLISLTISNKSPLTRVIFAGLSPTPGLIPLQSISAKTPIIFIPARTDICFYDFFIVVPADRALYAFSTIPVANSVFSSSTVSTPGNTPLNPFTLLEIWIKDLKDAGLPKLNPKCCYIKGISLLAQLGSPYKPPPPPPNPAKVAQSST